MVGDYLQKLEVTAIKREPASAQTTVYFIKESTLNLKHFTSAEAGTQATLSGISYLTQHFDTAISHCPSNFFIFQLRYNIKEFTTPFCYHL